LFDWQNETVLYNLRRRHQTLIEIICENARELDLLRAENEWLQKKLKWAEVYIENVRLRGEQLKISCSVNHSNTTTSG